MFEFVKINRPGDSRINQLLSIPNEIHQSFHYGFETRGVFA